MSRSKKMNVKKLVLAAVFIAIIIVMTAVPYTGYITYLPGGIAITTLHIPVIIGAVFLGWKYGALLGGVWGLTCVVKAYLNPEAGNIPFQNPLVSVLPRIIVGIVAGLVFALVAGRYSKKSPEEQAARRRRMAQRDREILAAGIAALAGTLTNTVLVLTMLHFFGALGTTDIAQVFSTVVKTIVGINGAIELCAALIIVPALWGALGRTYRERFEGGTKR